MSTSKEQSAQPGSFYHWMDWIGIAVSGAMILAALAAMVAFPWLAWRWSRQPFPAMLFGPSYVASDMSPAHWPGARQGIHSPDFLEAVDGVRLNTAFDLERRMLTRQPGEQAALSLRRPDGTARTVTVVLMKIGAADLLVYMVLPYLSGWMFLAIGMWVYRKRYAYTDGRAFGMLCAGAAIVIGGMFENSTTHVFSWLWSAGVPLTAGAVTALALVFPQELAGVRRWPILRWLPLLAGLGLAAAAQPAIYDLSAPWDFAIIWQPSLIFFIVGLGLLYARVGYLRVRSASPLVRQQSRVILAGSLTAFAPLAVEVCLDLLLHMSFPLPAPVYTLPTAIWPLALAYAVLRYRLWDMDLIIQRGVVYGTLTGLLAGVYVLLLAVLSPFFVWLLGREDNATAVFVATAALAVLFTPARNAVQATLDRLFYRDRLDLRAAQREITQALSTMLTLEQVTQLFTEYVPRRLRFEQATLWLNTPDGPKPYPPQAPLAVESATLATPLGAHGIYAVGMSLAGRPPNREEADLLAVLGHQAAVTLENVRLAAELASRARVEQEMTIARETQLSLLPASAPQAPGWDIAGYSQPAAEVGGDFYIYHPLPGGALGISVGDVSGKGMSAALLMSGSVIALSAACESDPAPAELLEKMDRVLQPYRGEAGRNTALCYVRLPPANGAARTICAANAGMIAPLVRRADGEVMWLNVRGLPLGAPHIETGYLEARVSIEPGDLIVIASDGIIERMSPTGDLFGFARFEKTVAECAPHLDAARICRLILEKADAHARSAAPHDDMTLVVVRAC